MTAFWIATTIALAWGALAFGAVYPWAYWPLVVAALALGSWGIARARGAIDRPDKIVMGSDPVHGCTCLAAAIALFVVAILLQMAPLPSGILRTISPATDAFLRAHDFRYALGATSVHALSINPRATWLGAMFVASFALFFFGCLRALSRGGAARIAAGVTILGTLLSLIGIIQAPLFDGKIYGFWTPLIGGTPFGPFVNKNHFAGWMIMGLSLSLGYLYGRVVRAARRLQPTRQSVLAWLASPDASQVVLSAMAVLLMALALVLTMSRSGISCFMLSIVITGFFVMRTRRGATKVAAVAYLFLLIAIAIGWAGVDLVASRFVSANWDGFDGRAILWRDAWTTAMRFMPFGTGFNTYGDASLALQTIDPTTHALETHNDYLQVIYEGGFFLTVPIVLAVFAFARSVRERFRDAVDDTMTRSIRAGAVTGLVAIAFQETVDFSLQMPANAALFALLAALAAHRPPVRPMHPAP